MMEKGLEEVSEEVSEVVLEVSERRHKGQRERSFEDDGMHLRGGDVRVQSLENHVILRVMWGH